MTAAHKTLPFGTKLRVTNLRNGRSVLVTVNDRGPYTRNRQLDLSLGAARQLGLVRPGTAPVLIEGL
jgi:rare lipoprotein A